MYKIAIDPGHLRTQGCPDLGAVGLIDETDTVKYIAKKLDKLLVERGGFDCKWVRPDTCWSVTDSLSKRCGLANSWGADIFVSIHLNAYNGKAKGTETFYYSTSSNGVLLAKSIQKKLVQNLETVDRGAKASNKFFVLRNTNMPAVLVEVIFCDNEEDVKKLVVEKAAFSIYEGICDYFKIPYDKEVKEE